MLDIVAWLALGISSILAVIEIIKLVKYWKKPKLEVQIDVPYSKMETKNNIKWVELKHIDIRLINSGNEDVFIKSLRLGHKDYDNTLTLMSIDRDFNLPARQVKDYFPDFIFPYKPKEHKSGGEFDNIFVIANDGKKNVSEIFYFQIAEENGNGMIHIYFKESSLRKKI